VSDELDSGCLSYSDEFGNGNKDHSSCLCQIEHHIIYSHSYRVPVMYFNIYKPGLLFKLSFAHLISDSYITINKD
jgi:Autophagocytosis associated protein, active-site domain